ncbi:hypothetical protein ACFOTA_05450 [Chitinophaga sp. GCM10012297]|uniref:Uncharacterized protein n=1 Tax=Chitinophaga chungangae TaxID=2821488 RepID=A0ABS3YAD6_9BACT|nr:hypothetical protein [Chitinophaga chungangae]MBO9151641.1 hypothetical protein [Chitinophaga chungangae]
MVISGELVHMRMDSGMFRIKIYGDSAVITSKGTSAGTWKGMPFSFFEWSTSMPESRRALGLRAHDDHAGKPGLS